MRDNTTHGDKDDQTGLEVNDTFRLLANERRRETIRLLSEHNCLSKRELSERMCCEGNRKAVYISLHQCHLPKLVRHNVIKEDRDIYELGPNASELLPYLGGPPASSLRQTIAGFVTP